MGVSLTELITPKPLSLDELKDKVVAIDAFNYLYQFLTTLRGPDGALLTNSKGEVTSHLVGLFSRTTRLMEKGIKCVFVFDGEPPALKKKERERRRKLKEQAHEAYKVAQEREDISQMKKLASRTTSLTEEMIESAKELITALGLPVVQAPSEGEAQAAYMSQKGDVDFVVSQDTDAFLFGAPQVIKNLSILGRRKKVSKLTYETVQPELITLSELLNELGIDRDKLIALSMLVGTDFNVGGIKGIGPKNGLKLVKKFPDFDVLFKEIKWSDYFEYDWKDVFNLFKSLRVTDDYILEWKAINANQIESLLCTKYEFSKERVHSTLKKLSKTQSAMAQKGLGDFV